MSSRPVQVVIFALAATLTSVFFINFCATVFRCGCVSLWSGADTHCNVHIQGVKHCPWCSNGLAASMVPYLIMVAVQAAISFSPRPVSPVIRFVAAAAAFPVVGAVLAAIYQWASGY